MDAISVHTDVATMGHLVESGQSLRAIGSLVGLSPTTIYRRLVRDGDQYQRRRRRPMQVEDRRAILAQARQGEVSVRRIAVAVGRSWHTVRRVVEAEGLPRLVPTHRCPRCGYWVRVHPCLICQAQEEAIRAHTSKANAVQAETDKEDIGREGIRSEVEGREQAMVVTAPAVRTVPAAGQVGACDPG